MDRERVGPEPLTPGAEDRAAVEWLIRPLIPWTLRPTYLIGPPGSMKSYLALALGLGLCTGRVTIPGTAHSKGTGPVLYLDWEADRQTFERRLGTLARGYFSNPDGEGIDGIYYRPMRGPLADSRERQIIRALVAGEGIPLVIVDSAALAAGPGVDWAESAVKLTDILSRLGCATLVIAQQSWESIEEGRGRPFGSVLHQYAAGMAWAIRKGDDGIVTLKRTKFSEGEERGIITLWPAWEPTSLRFLDAAPKEQWSVPLRPTGYVIPGPPPTPSEADPAPDTDKGERERLLAIVGDRNRPTHEIISILMGTGMSRRTAFRRLDFLRGRTL